MTSFYMFRLIYLTFFGESRMSHEAEHHVHESPKSMTVPLVVAGDLLGVRRVSGIAAESWADRIAFEKFLSRCSRGSAGLSKQKARGSWPQAKRKKSTPTDRSTR